MQDSRFVYEVPISWRNGCDQTVFNYVNSIIGPTRPLEEKPQQIDFELKSINPLVFGNCTQFKVQGRFERRVNPTDNWEAVPVTDASDIILAPNWFEFMIKSIEIYNVNGMISNHKEANSVPYLLNTYLYSIMNKHTKKFLCPEETSPGNAVPSISTPWDFASEEWTNYATKVFGKEDFYFHWVPLHTFPFFQSPNFIMDAVSMRALPPLQSLGAITCRITLRNDLECIWRKRPAANNTHSYRFKFMDMTLCLQEALPNPRLEKNVFSPSGRAKLLHYPGVTKFMKPETIGQNELFYNCKFQCVPFPEGIFIFAVPKKMMDSSYKYSDHEADAPIFTKHYIESLTVSFDGQELYWKKPHNGTLKDKLIQLKRFRDYFYKPPFGLDMDKDQLKLSDVKNLFSDTNFPSVYHNLCIEGKYRLVPYENNGSILAKDGELNIGIKFEGAGASNDATYMVYLFFTDNNFVLDLKTRTFSASYNVR